MTLSPGWKGPAPTPTAAGSYVDPWNKQPAAPTGNIGVNLADPVGSISESGQSIGDRFDGLKHALFGTDTPDRTGERHGLIPGSGVPILGDIGRAIAGIPGAIVGAVPAVVGGAVGAAVNVANRLPNLLPGGNVMDAALEAQFNALPDSSPAKQAALAKIKEDGGFLNTGAFLEKGHLMSEALRQAGDEQNILHPDLMRGLLVTPGSLSDTIMNVIGGLGLLQRGAERFFAERSTSAKNADGSGNVGITQLEGLQAVAAGKAVFQSGSAGLSPVEQMTVDKVNNGDWTEAEGLDYLASHGAGLSHDQLTEIALSFATDPLMVASLGAGAIASVGAKSAELLGTLTKAERFLDAARAAEVAGEVGAADRVAAAEKAVALAQQRTLTTADRVGPLNLPGQLGRSQHVSAFARDVFGKAYTGLEGTGVGRTAKAVRTLIDPFHVINFHRVATDKTMELVGDIVSKTTAAAYGEFAYRDALVTLHKVAPELYEDAVNHWSVYSLNLGRETLAELHLQGVLEAGMLDGLKPATIKEQFGTIENLVDELGHKAQSNLPDELKIRANRVRIGVWDEAAQQDLAQRLANTFKVKTKEDWLEHVIRPLAEVDRTGLAHGKDTLSVFHAMTYGAATQQLVRARLADIGSHFAGKANRFTLIAKRTLTDVGSDGIIKRIETAIKNGDIKEALREFEEGRRLYPELRIHTVEDGNAVEGLDRFINKLKARREALPSQVLDDEVQHLSPELQQLREDWKDSYTLGFMPEEEYRWGIDFSGSASGEAVVSSPNVWAGQVGLPEGANLGYRAAKYVTVNFRGQPILGAVARPFLKGTDAMEAMGRVMRSRVSGSVIATAAHNKFIDIGVQKHGMSRSEATKIIDALQELTGDVTQTVNPRGLLGTQMWHAAKPLIPDGLKHSMTQRDIIKMVVDAYEGDMRFVGATQKLSGRVKSMLGPNSGNVAGAIAEHLYPLMKFRLNAVFQMQERIEPWVLNAQRGVHWAVGTDMNANDVLTQKKLANMTNSSLFRMGDMDNVEQGAGIIFGKELTAQASRPGTAIGKIKQFGKDIADVQGAKRLNMLRTFQHGLGREMKASYEASQPGLWQAMKDAAQLHTPELLSDDAFAIRIMGEQMGANDIVVRRMLKSGILDYKAEHRAATATGAWMSSAHVGELRNLELDTMAEVLRFSDNAGKDITTADGLRAALGRGDITMDRIKDQMARASYHPDYARRVESALTFHYGKFMETLAERYNLDKAGVEQINGFFKASASLREMTPAEFLSQVFMPTVTSKDPGAGHLGELMKVMRGGREVEVPNLAQLTSPLDPITKEFSGTLYDLTHQLSAVMSRHLDPSAKLKLLAEFQPELRDAIMQGHIGTAFGEADALFDQHGVATSLADSILGNMKATEGDLWEAALPTTIKDYDEMFPLTEAFPVTWQGKTITHASSPVGPGLKALMGEGEHGVAMTRGIISRVARTRRIFPDVPQMYIDRLDIGGHFPNANAVHIAESDTGFHSILFHDTQYGSAEGRGLDALNQWPGGAQRATFPHHTFRYTDDGYEFTMAGRKEVPRRSNYGVEFFANGTKGDTIDHEMAHAIDGYYRSSSPFADPRFRAETSRGNLTKAAKLEIDKAAPYDDFINRFRGSPAHRALSEYSHDGNNEMSAELISVLLNPGDLKRFNRPLQAYDLENIRIATESHLFDAGFHMDGPQTVEEAITELRQIFTDMGAMHTPPLSSTNPDVLRVQRFFAEFSQKAVHEGLFGAADNRFQPLLRQFSKLDRSSAVPYDLTQARLIQAVNDGMASKWRDAYRLQYFDQNRSMLERSINHPMFGIYPASYMWGKIMPELVRFVASEPFGLRTGAAAYAAHDIQQAVGIQREFDPSFDAKLDEVGHNQALWFAGYMLPAVPWDIPANVPAWMRSLSDQGAAAQKAADSGREGATPDVMKAVGRQIDISLNPGRQVQYIHDAADSINKMIGGKPAKAGSSRPFTTGPQGTPQQTGPVQAGDLGGTLGGQLQELSNVFGR